MNVLCTGATTPLGRAIIERLLADPSVGHVLAVGAEHWGPGLPSDGARFSYQPIDPFRMNVEFRYVGQRFNDVLNTQPMPAFDVWNLSATYDVLKQVQAYLRVDNLFDRRYEELLYFGVPGRSIYGGVRVSLDLL